MVIVRQVECSKTCEGGEARVKQFISRIVVDRGFRTDLGPMADRTVKPFVARLRVRALGIATRLLPAPTPFAFTGPGSSAQLVRMIADRGARTVLVVTDAVLVELGVVDPVLAALEQAGIEVRVFSDVEPDPTIDVVMDGVARLRESRADAVLAVGGGSPIDAAKAIIACAARGCTAGGARRLFQGSATRGSVLRHPHHRGHGIRSHGRLGHFRSREEAQIRDR